VSVSSIELDRKSLVTPEAINFVYAIGYLHNHVGLGEWEPSCAAEEEEVILEITPGSAVVEEARPEQISERPTTRHLGVTIDGRSKRGVVGQTQELGVLHYPPHARPTRASGEVENRSLNRRHRNSVPDCDVH
jgi:hypothetical protein